VLIEDAEFEDAREQLTTLQGRIEFSEDVVVPDTLARIEYYLGILEFFDGDAEGATLDFWRQALSHDAGFAWEGDLVGDPGARDLFEALRSEVKARPQSASGVPEEEIDGFLVYVDGAIAHSYDMVLQGRHLVQVRCPDETLHANWTEYGGDNVAPDYVAMCPGLSLALLPPPPPPPSSRDGLSGLQIGLFAGGGALLVGGTAMNFLVVNPAWDDVQVVIDDPEGFDRDAASARSDKFNVSRWITLGLLGAGAATAGTGLFVADGWMLVPAGPGLGVIHQF
jgi:hypothetical protein